MVSGGGWGGGGVGIILINIFNITRQTWRMVGGGGRGRSINSFSITR